MLRRLLGNDALVFDAQHITNLPAKPRPLAGHADRAAKARVLANTQGYDLLVFVKDVDRQGGTARSTSERKVKLARVAAEIQSGLDAAQSERTLAIKATPCRMLECWALADEKALAEISDTDEVQVPNSPEDTWGKHDDPRSNHPKCALRRALGREPNADDFAALAASSSIERLRSRCPDSFVPFHDEASKASKRLAR
jgi:hypothetical protein